LVDLHCIAGSHNVRKQAGRHAALAAICLASSLLGCQQQQQRENKETKEKWEKTRREKKQKIESGTRIY
jgi:hypothetical protein